MTTQNAHIQNLHLTVAAIIERNNSFLLVTDDTSLGYKLNQPAGHVEDGEDIIDAVVRETKEECGLNFYPEKIVGIYLYKLNPTNTYLRICFKGDFDGDTENPKPSAMDDGVIEAQWYALADLPDLEKHFRSSLVKKCIEDYLDGQEFDLSILAAYQDCSLPVKD